jgi:hypothetical protein
MNSDKIEVTIQRGVSGLVLLLLAWVGEPDLIDALIYYLMK